MTYAANTDLLDEFNKYNNFSFVKCDINDLEFLYECDYIINTAAETHVGNSIVDNNDFIHSNINGVHNLLELIRNYRAEGKSIPTLIHFSTDEVYGDIDTGMHNEEHLLKPSNPYSATKAAADQLILAWARTYNLPYVIVRPTNNYGIGQYVEKLIPKAIKYLELGRKIPLHNNGSPVRTWLHANDTAKAILTIIDKNKSNEIFNISGGFEQTNLETIEKILKIYKMSFNIDNIHSHLDLSYSRPGQDIRYSLDDSKLRLLGWKPELKFDNELYDIIKYYKDKFIW